MRRARSLLLVLALAGCESGTSATLLLDVTAGVVSATSSEAPGVLVATVDDGSPAPVLALCGAPLAEPYRYYRDFGFGCLGEREGTSARLAAWVQPMPASWDAEAFCALEPQGSSGIVLDDEVGGDVDGGAPYDALAMEPEASWPSAETSAPWTRDVSPCGGKVEGSLRVE